MEEEQEKQEEQNRAFARRIAQSILASSALVTIAILLGCYLAPSLFPHYYQGDRELAISASVLTCLLANMIIILGYRTLREPFSATNSLVRGAVSAGILFFMAPPFQLESVLRSIAQGERYGIEQKKDECFLETKAQVIPIPQAIAKKLTGTEISACPQTQDTEQ